MTPAEQKQLISQLLGRMKGEVYAHIDSGKIPSSWDGLELRWLIATKAQNNTVNMHDGLRHRKKDYENHVLIKSIV